MRQINRPNISVIVPVYNAGQTLKKCIESLLEQTYINFELLLINVGIIDDSGFVCDQYALKDERIKVFHKKNSGVSSARNVGLDNANGEWIAFCDADDWVESMWLEQYIGQLDVKSDLVVQGFKCKNWPDGNTNIGIESYIGDPKSFLIELHNKNIIGYLWCKLFKNAIIEHHHMRFNVQTAILEDEEFVLNYITKVKHVSNVFMGYYNYTYPDYHSKYYKKHQIEVAKKMTAATKIIYGNDYLYSPLAARYYHMALGLLSIAYKNSDSNRKSYLNDFLTYYRDEIKSIGINRTLFKPVKHILFERSVNLSHFLFSMFVFFIKLLKK